MTARRYEVYGPCPGCATVGGCGNKRTLLDSIPDDLLEEAAKVLMRRFPISFGSQYLAGNKEVARAALSVLFPDVEEE